MIKFYHQASDEDVHWVRYADLLAERSKDPSTKTGCVLVKQGIELVGSWNQFPVGVDVRPERFERPDKYLYTEHSERMCFDLMAKRGTSVRGATLYSNWFPCAECTRGIIGCGITRAVGVRPDFSAPKYEHEFEVAVAMLNEARVAVVYVGERDQQTGRAGAQ